MRLSPTKIFKKDRMKVLIKIVHFTYRYKFGSKVQNGKLKTEKKSTYNEKNQVILYEIFKGVKR